MPAPDLAVAIVSYGSAPFIPACLRTLYAAAAADDLTLQVVIADNDPRTPLTDELVAGYPGAVIISCENHGFGAGNNVAHRATDPAAPAVLFLNPDTEIRAGSLAALLRRFDEDPRLGLLGCRQIAPDGELTPTIRRFPGVGRALADALGTERLLKGGSPGERVLRTAAYETDTPCDWTSGSFMLARRAALDSLGAEAVFDERFFLFSEEVDLCRRVTNAGWAIRHSAALEILHYTNRAGVDPKLTAQEVFARRQYAEKHFGRTRRTVYLTVMAAKYALRGGLRRRPGHDPAAETAPSRAQAAERALRILAGVDPPPFGRPEPGATP